MRTYAVRIVIYFTSSYSSAATLTLRSPLCGSRTKPSNIVIANGMHGWPVTLLKGLKQTIYLLSEFSRLNFVVHIVLNTIICLLSTGTHFIPEDCFYHQQQQHSFPSVEKQGRLLSRCYFALVLTRGGGGGGGGLLSFFVDT